MCQRGQLSVIYINFCYSSQQPRNHCSISLNRTLLFLVPAIAMWHHLAIAEFSQIKKGKMIVDSKLRAFRYQSDILNET